MFFLQIVLYLFVNTLFILKYFPRSGTGAPVFLVIYIIFIFLTVSLYKKYFKKISERTFKIAFLALLILMVIAITGALISIDRYSVRVDRWSAVTFFLDNLFHGQYPYSAHTHVSTTNYASPFPVWHFINIPFYLVGDVGIGLIFFLLLTAFIVQYFFSDYRKSFFFMLLLCIAPAYWWEVAVRSDSLSNALLVFVFILGFTKSNFKLSRNYWLCIVVCGLYASTRFTAILPLALYFFKPYMQLSWKQKIIFPIGVVAITTFTFLPFILWDTNNWIFFSRNPFMSQTSIGNPYLLLCMLILGCIAAYSWKNSTQFFAIASMFLFVFVLSSQFSLIITRGIKGSVFEDSLYDISYFSLIFPYCLAYLSEAIDQNKIIENHIP
jgi:hypothetical protein